MLIYSKPLTADMQILWGCSPTLCSNEYGEVNARGPIRRPGTDGTFNAHTSSSDVAPVLIVPVQAVAQLLPAGRWAEERLEGDNSFHAFARQPCPTTLCQYQHLPSEVGSNGETRNRGFFMNRILQNESP